VLQANRYHLEFLENLVNLCFLFHPDFLQLLVFLYFRVNQQVQYFLSIRLDQYRL
jgi:hypothetical protein